MPFKKQKPHLSAPPTPLQLIPLLTRRNIPDAMSHQKEMLTAYAEKMVDAPDVALQLPTGSGKTLVGLLIAEWRRRKFNDRVVYLCPTRQLVNQVVKQAEKEYGIDAIAFTKSKHQYRPVDTTAYRTRSKLAVTTYSSLFNAYPFFEDPETIILDDAHAAENYIAKMWSLEIPRTDPVYASLHAGLSGVLQEHISRPSYRRLTGALEASIDPTWVDKLPTKLASDLETQIINVLDAHEEISDDMKFTWPLLRDHIRACHIYLTSREILIRPLIPPTWTHEPFNGASQRIYMSATLGPGGDLERLTGRSNIARIEAPHDFRAAGVGRRFFMFPGLSLESHECDVLRLQISKSAGRSVVLTSNKVAAEMIKEQFTAGGEFESFDADDVEKSKEEFVKSQKAVAILAGRFDGMDFPNEECRFLCLDGLPKATNAQERFLMSRMGAAALLNERIQTRVLQAVGRCTRALQDRSAVFVTGDELLYYLTNEKKWQHFHPELQAELAFGVTQSKEAKSEDLLTYFESFSTNDYDWDQANSDIVDAATNYVQEPYPAMNELESVVGDEIEFQGAIWNGNFVHALESARHVITKIKAPSLRGYRALWYYLAGSTAQNLIEEAGDTYDNTARTQFAAALNAAPTIPWLADMSRSVVTVSLREHTQSVDAISQVERLERELMAMGTVHDTKFEIKAKQILEGLARDKTFEESQRQLGELLGFLTGNGKGDGEPDPWWLTDSKGVVFEDHAGGAASTVFGASKARQAAGHPVWLADNCNEAQGIDLIAVLVTPCTVASKGAKSQLKAVLYWHLDDFLNWATNAINVLRGLKSSLSEDGDLFWRANAVEKLKDANLTLDCILNMLPQAVDEMDFQAK